MRNLTNDELAATSWSVLATNFDRSKPKRLISGIAISGPQRNANDNSFVASGLEDRERQIPLLLDHEWVRPIGRVTRLEVIGKQVHFSAEISNTDAMLWSKDIWPRILACDLTRCSIQALPVGDQRGNEFKRWSIGEVSLVELGADSGAVICRAWEHDTVIRVGRPSTIVHWDRRKQAIPDGVRMEPDESALRIVRKLESERQELLDEFDGPANKRAGNMKLAEYERRLAKLEDLERLAREAAEAALEARVAEIEKRVNATQAPRRQELRSTAGYLTRMLGTERNND